MRIPHAALPFIRLFVVVVFAALAAVFFGYLWVNSGGRLPLISSTGYQVSVNIPTVANLVPDSDVMVSGVKVGKVADVHAEGDRAAVSLRLNPGAAPLHEGASIQVRNKTLIQETFLEVTDGAGAQLPSGHRLPDSAGKPAVELNDVLASIDPATREALASTVRSLGAGTKDSQQSISAALAGLGHLGREGKDALDALSSQSDDLRKLTGHAATLLTALDTGQGRIAKLVEDADRITKATADGSGDVEAVVKELPGLLTTAKDASDDLTKLSGALAPVASNLKAASPDLARALQELPQTSADLRALLPSLNGVLDKGPDTLARVPVVSADARQAIPTVTVALGDVNPVLSYLKPYGRDVAGFFTNLGQALSRGDVNGTALRVFVIFNEQSVRGLPFDANSIAPLNKSNPYPAPGQAANPGPFDGKYPRVEKEGK
jgi:phospholipid/cholesterol/gamma-HCH transport system substrate-binding protein